MVDWYDKKGKYEGDKEGKANEMRNKRALSMEQCNR